MEIFFKIIKLISDIISNKSQDLSDQVLIKIRKLVLLIIAALGSMALVCVGTTIVLMDLVAQSNSNQNFTLSGSIQIGITTVVVMLGLFFYCLSNKNWFLKTQINQNDQLNKTSPIEDAIGLLIKDIVVERQEKRNHE